MLIRNYGNQLSDILNFDESEHNQIDDFIVSCLEYHYQYTEKVYFANYDLRYFTFSKDKQNYSFDYFKYGYNLVKHGLTLALVETLMEVKIRELLEKLDDTDKLTIFCLLFIKAMIPSLQKGDMCEFLCSCGQLTSDSVDLRKYEVFYKAPPRDIVDILSSMEVVSDSEIADIIASYEGKNDKDNTEKY